jgi:glc operon protein GlcG
VAMRLRPVLTQADARLALDTMRKLADQYCATNPGTGAVMVVVDDHGELIALERMDNAPLTSITIATNKAYTAAREKAPSALLGEKNSAAKRGEGNFEFAFFGDQRMIGWGGGSPVIIDGVCAGAVAISGLPESVDKAIAAEAVDAIVTFHHK